MNQLSVGLLNRYPHYLLLGIPRQDTLPLGSSDPERCSSVWNTQPPLSQSSSAVWDDAEPA